ncbi:MAG: GGDEF domain-containing protein [Lachnospiraceae bacterium]|nr:GGDEF domain-containing protein [Lachnospiraceae bacterium]
MTFIDKIKEILFRDVTGEDKLKDLVFLIRILCIINIVSNSIWCAFFALSLNSRLYQWSIAFIVIYILTFWMTYWDHSNTNVYVYAIATILSMLVYSFSIGPVPGYLFTLYSLILLFYFKTDDNPLYKAITAIIIAVIVIGVWFYLTSANIVVAFTRRQALILLLTNTIYLSLTFITISYSFYLKFASNEHKILKYAKKLEKLATLDPLTQLTNRRGMTNHLESFIADSSSQNQLSLAISDIDFFKKVNDTYGHDAGDYVLIELSKMFREFMRDKGWIARWGGEEFLFAFEGTNGDYAFEQLTKLKYSIEKKEFSYKEYKFSVTMTFGLEEYDSSADISETIKNADNKLYQGKESGRNRIIY